MRLYTPSELKKLLHSIGAAPLKRLSQHFLIDGNIVRNIATLADIQQGDVVLEIGPGPGALTEELLNRGAHVMAVEKDRAFASALEQLQTPDGRLQVYEADILSWKMPKVSSPIKLVSNLPYHLTAPILGKFLPQTSVLSSMTLMVQHEVAERMGALPGSSAYGLLTLLIQFYGHLSKGFSVSPSCFYPIPKVSSAVVKLTLTPPPLPPDDHPAWFGMVKLLFQQRRKMIRSSLKSYDFKGSTINPRARPEELSLHDFLLLFHEIHPPRHHKPEEQHP